MTLSTIQLRLLTRACPDIPQLVLINQEAFPPSERASIDGSLQFLRLLRQLPVQPIPP